jgi:type II secretory pathway pseudopilin PulG
MLTKIVNKKEKKMKTFIKFKSTTKKKGFTLIEILLVVGFIALAGIGVYVVYDKVETANIVNKEYRNIQTLNAGIKNLYRGVNNYSGLFPRIVILGQVVPEEMILLGTAGRVPATTYRLQNSFSSPMTLEAASYNGGTDNAYLIITDVPKKVCAKMATTMSHSFNKVEVDTTTVKDTAANQRNVNVSAAAAACEASAQENVSLKFTSL